MAISATMVWEIQPANGALNGGGGFKPGASGTDKTYPTSAPVARTDIVLATSTTMTSAGTPFDATDVGNCIAITAGTNFTVGIYEIVSQAAGTATVDRAAGTGGATGGSGTVGGARRGYNDNGGTPGTTLQSVLVAGNKVWIKNEAWNELATMSVAGSAGSPIVHEGYNTTRADAPTGANRPTDNRASAAGNAIANSGGRNWFKNIRATAAAGAGFFITASNCLYDNCRSYSNGTKGFDLGSSTNNMFINCESDLNTTRGMGDSFTPLQIHGCYIHDNTTGGINSGGFSITVSFSIIEANASHGIQNVLAGGSSIINCTIDGNSGASVDGINGSTSEYSIVVGTILSNNGRYGANMSANANSTWSDYNDYFGNGTAARNNFPTGTHDVTTDPTFTDRANGNFAIGTNLKALGFPGVFPGGLSTGYLDIGAVQRQESSNGGVSQPYVITNAGNRSMSY